ncbi:MAG: ribosome-binding factor A, partial [bacterium]
ESASGYIQSEVGTRLGTKFTPHLRFVFDSSIAYGDHIERILDEIPDE